MASLRLLRFAPPSPRTFANIREDWAQEPAAPCLLFGVSQPRSTIRPLPQMPPLPDEGSTHRRAASPCDLD